MIRQKIIQKSEILNCFPDTGNADSGNGGDGVNNNNGHYNVFPDFGVEQFDATNSAASEALQQTYNIYNNDDAIIQQTIIIPKSCTANIFASVTINNQNTISQTIGRDFAEKQD